MSEMDLWEIENGFYARGVTTICGVDEAGRGPLAGPVCAAAVILPPNLVIPGLNDSKKLTDKKRRELAPKLTASIFCRQPFWPWSGPLHSFSFARICC